MEWTRKVGIGASVALLATGGALYVAANSSDDNCDNRDSVSCLQATYDRVHQPTPTPSPVPDPTSPTTVPPVTVPPTPLPTPTVPPTSVPVPPSWPTVDNTGVPANTALRPSGSLIVTENGAVIDGLRINGTLRIYADNVTVKNTLVNSTTTTYPVQIGGDNFGFVMEDSEIDGNGKASVAILKEEFTLRRVEIRNVKDGPRIEGDNVLIEDSLIWNLTRVEGGHHDILQIRKGFNFVVRDNSLLAYNTKTKDPMNAVLQVGSPLGPIGNILFEGNFMTGGNYTINGGGDFVQGAVYRSNTIVANFRYGPKQGVGSPQVWDATNVVVAPDDVKDLLVTQ